MTCEIINNIPDIKDLSYLELGIGNGKNFEMIDTINKTSVDSNRECNATIHRTTDAFFGDVPEGFEYDIIFIDANHDLEHATRDFNNSIQHCSRWVIMHDMIPPSEKFTDNRFCSDSYRLLYALLNSKNHTVYPMKGNMGLTFIKMPAKKIRITKAVRELTYSEFAEFIKTQKLYNGQEVKDILCES